MKLVFPLFPSGTTLLDHWQQDDKMILLRLLRKMLIFCPHSRLFDRVEDENKTFNSVDDKPLSHKSNKQRVFFTDRMPLKAGKTHGTRSNLKKLMKVVLVESKHNTQKYKKLKKRAIIEFYVPT